jgi:GNAT superfamily N-acetyltransferase
MTPNSELTIRPALEKDAEPFLLFLTAFDRESRFMAIEPGERRTDAEGMRAHIAAVSRGTNHLLLLAAAGDEVIGYLEAIGGSQRRIAHRASLNMGVLASHAGQGVGRRLLEEMETWARKTGIERWSFRFWRRTTGPWSFT